MRQKDFKEKIKKVMDDNLVRGYSKYLGRDFCYVAPSKSKYPFQWFWDTFFHIYILCALEDYQMAKDNLESLFALQAEDGFVGHMIYWQSALPPSLWQVLQAHPKLNQFRPHMSALIQPTFAAQALERIYQRTGDRTFLQKMLPKVKKYHNWLAANRSYEEDGLIFIISPFESGFDEKPSYDQLVGSAPQQGTWRQYFELMRIDARNFFSRYDLPKLYKENKFVVKDTAMNVIYALDLLALARLSKENNEVDAESHGLLAKKVQKSIIDLMYNSEDQAFYDLRGYNNSQLGILTFSTFFPIALPDLSKDIAHKIIQRYLLNEKEFNLKYPIPTMPISSKVFNPREDRTIFFDFLWRGPTWPMVNWFLFHALANKGYKDIAETLHDKTVELIELSGFREYYNPLTGEGYGAKNFTWSGLILDMELPDAA